MEPIITLNNITKTFPLWPHGTMVALKDISLEIHAGEIFALLGPSGSGKSTLLRIMSGLEGSYQGTVALGQGFSREDTSFVFQQFALLPWLTVSENIEIGLLARKVPQEEREEKIKKETKRFHLENFTHAYPHELSGGMKQRVGIARALATEPKIIFMDEAFSELDSFTAEELRQEFLSIWQETKITIVMVTHLIEEALVLADRIAIFTPRPGKVEKIVENTLPRPRQKRHEDFYRLEDQLYKLIRP